MTWAERVFVVFALLLVSAILLVATLEVGRAVSALVELERHYEALAADPLSVQGVYDGSGLVPQAGDVCQQYTDGTLDVAECEWSGFDNDRPLALRRGGGWWRIR